MPTTANKGYEVPTTGTEVNTWGDKINTGSFAVIDSNVGGIVTKTLSNTTVNLSAAESQNSTVRLIGTLSANVLVTTLATGFQFVENATTGAFTVTFQKLGVGAAITIPQGTRAVVVMDPTNAARVAADNQTEFASGARLPFALAVAPTGWTKDVTAAIHNAGIRLTTGVDGNTTGGSADFDAIFTTRAITGTANGTAITNAQMPVHQHFCVNGDSSSGFPTLTGSNSIIFYNQTGSNTNNYQLAGSFTNPDRGLTNAAGAGQTHDHALTINNLNMSLKYLNMIICQKN